MTTWPRWGAWREVEGDATPGTALRPAYRDSGMVVAVGGWKVDIANLVGSAMRRIFLDRDGATASLRAIITVWLLPQSLSLLPRQSPLR